MPSQRNSFEKLWVEKIVSILDGFGTSARAKGIVDKRKIPESIKTKLNKKSLQIPSLHSSRAMPAV